MCIVLNIACLVQACAESQSAQLCCCKQILASKVLVRNIVAVSLCKVSGISHAVGRAHSLYFITLIVTDVLFSYEECASTVFQMDLIMYESKIVDTISIEFQTDAAECDSLLLGFTIQQFNDRKLDRNNTKTVDIVYEQIQQISARVLHLSVNKCFC